MKLINAFSRSSIGQQIKNQQSKYSNLNDKIIQLTQRNLLNQANHPLSILKNSISNFLTQKQTEIQKNPFKIFDDFLPIVTTKQNFDDLLVPTDHVSRKRSDTYYINQSLLLRTHTSCHQKQLLAQNIDQFVVFGDVYRRDEIDNTHYPAFHQMEAVKVFSDQNILKLPRQLQVQLAVDDLKETLEQLVKLLFGEVQMRWTITTFPFTDPSFELEIYRDNKWMEMLGCGIIHQDLMKSCNRQHQVGWAAGLGLERFAIQLFDIPDIRLFWSQDQRFLSQFKEGSYTKFKPFSKYPPCYKDITFYVPQDFEENDLMEVIRQIGGDLIEKVECVDTYLDKKKGKQSKCYRINYRSLERTLQNEEIDRMQFQIRDEVVQKLNVILR